MRKTFVREIDGHRFEITQHPAAEGMNLLHRIAHVVTGVVERLPGQSGDLLQAEVTGALIAQACRSLLEMLGPDELDDTIRLAVRYTVLVAEGGEKLPLSEHYDDVFAGNYVLLAKLLYHIIDVNFRQVFQLAGVGARSAPAAG